MSMDIKWQREKPTKTGWYWILDCTGLVTIAIIVYHKKGYVIHRTVGTGAIEFWSAQNIEVPRVSQVEFEEMNVWPWDEITKEIKIQQ